MLEAKTSRFYQAALQSGLIDEAGLEACFALVPPEKRTPDAIDRRMARQAISTNRLTLWQAQQLLAGRSTGFKIDKYVLLDLLGRGGMGRVYLAMDVRLNRRVALKILSQERMNNPRAIARFQREAKVGAQLQHENLVRVYDEGDFEGIRFLVMEYIEGKNVGQLIVELGTIPWPTAARLGRQVALGLEHARLKSLIHRDVNPCNVLVTQDGSAKLTDLGLAIDLSDHDNVTRDGATVGTFDYVSPEQARNSRGVDSRADIYSLGCTIFHMIAGRVPFPVTSLPEKLYAHQLHDAELLSDLVPGVPQGLAEVVRKMMRKLPEERYQTPLDAALALEPFAIESGWTSTPLAAPAGSSSGVRDAVAKRGPTLLAEVKAKANPSFTRHDGSAPSSWSPFMEAGAGASNAAGSATVAGSASDPSGSASSGLAPSSGNGSGSSSGSRAAASEPLASPETPVSRNGVSPNHPLMGLDLGPAEPLGLGLKSSTKLKAVATVLDPAEQRRRRLVMVAMGAGGALIALVTVVLLAVLSGSGSGGSSAAGTKDPSKSKTAPPPPLVHGNIVIRYRSGESEAVETLPDAIAMAVRDKAEIILAAGVNVRLTNEKPIRIPDGGLTIRAADGAKPVLEIVVKGLQPTLLVNANIRLAGLTVLVKYETASDAPVIQAERDLILERCVFRASGPANGSRLALAEGPRVTVSGCLFEGFDCPLEIAANPGMTATLKQSMFLAPLGPGDEASGRAVRVRSVFGLGIGCKLKVENCSTRAGVFLEASRFSSASPLAVEVSNSAFLVKSLLEYEGEEKLPEGIARSVIWLGKANHDQVNAPSEGTWATLTGGEKLPGGPTSLESWAKLFPEAETKVHPLKLAKQPPDPESIKDRALVGEDDKPVGADPKLVGPL